MSLERTTVRRARKERPCTDYLCGRSIKPGELYNEHVTSPGNEHLSNERWVRMAECAVCAAGRGLPIPGTEAGQ